MCFAAPNDNGTRKEVDPQYQIGFSLKRMVFDSKTFPRDPITLSEDDWGVQSPPKRKAFRFHAPILRR